jgi:hypothetical protein
VGDRIRFVVIDMSPVTDIDSSAMHLLGEGEGERRRAAHAWRAAKQACRGCRRGVPGDTRPRAPATHRREEFGRDRGAAALPSHAVQRTWPGCLLPEVRAGSPPLLRRAGPSPLQTTLWMSWRRTVSS